MKPSTAAILAVALVFFILLLAGCTTGFDYDPAEACEVTRGVLECPG